MVTLNAPVMAGPEVYIGTGQNLLGPDGKVNNDKTLEVLAGWANAYAKWVETNATKG
jgi:chromate reductase, NAD(P)H dehydrogenase (quinone)